MRAVGRSTRWRPEVVETLIAIYLLKPMFAVRARLREAAFAVRDALARGDLGRGAPRVRRPVQPRSARRRSSADALVAATIESVAENTSDSVVAPIFFLACGGVPAAIFYRAVNTLDAMVGYHGRFEYAGKASARLDDLLNLVPARLTAALLLVAGALTGAERRGGARSCGATARARRAPTRGGPWRRWRASSACASSRRGTTRSATRGARSAPAQITAAWRIASDRGASPRWSLAAIAAGALHG